MKTFKDSVLFLFSKSGFKISQLFALFFIPVMLLAVPVVFLASSIVAVNASAAPADSVKKLFILGDSLTEGYGVSQQSAFPHLLQRKIDEAKMPWKVFPSGSSGSTSASGPGRIKWIINPKNKDRPDVVLVLLGSNDGLRGFKPADTKKNLIETIRLIKKQNISVILGQLYMPPNYGKEYTEQFAKLFGEIGKEESVPVVSFLLDGVAGEPSLNLADGIHPNEKGHEKVAENLFKSLRPHLK